MLSLDVDWSSRPTEQTATTGRTVSPRFGAALRDDLMMGAEPIIDIQVGVVSLDDSTRIVAAVEALGYVYVPEFEHELPDRRFFRRASSTGTTTHHVHLVERTDQEWWDRHIWFRDWLRTHPEDRHRSAELKRSLASDLLDDRPGYTEAKTAFITSIVERTKPAS